MGTAAAAIELISLLNVALKAGIDIAGTVDKLDGVLSAAHSEGRDLTSDERKVYDAEIDALRAQLHAD